MTWQMPQSQTLVGIVVNLAANDDVFVASTVAIESLGNTTILGTASDHEALIYGTVAGQTNNTIQLGDNAAADSGEIVTISEGGQVHAFSAGVFAISIFATNSHISNQGLINAPEGSAIFMSGVSAATQSTINNSGTINAGLGFVRSPVSTETVALKNSGLIVGDVAAYAAFGSPDARDLITNTGKIVGDIFLFGGNDTYNGAQGRLAGVIHGGDGVDVIIGGKDNDVFLGEAGNDTLTGGLGKDSLTGGLGRDLFDFNSIKESVKGSKRDMINDFHHGNNVTGDDIDLRNIDAKTGVGGNQAFKFIGKQGFHDVKGELRYIDKGSKCIVQGDVNGDGHADFEIFVKIGSLHKGDFLL